METKLELQRTQQKLEIVKIQTAEEMEALDKQITDKKIDLVVNNALIDVTQKSIKELDEQFVSPYKDKYKCA